MSLPESYPNSENQPQPGYEPGGSLPQNDVPFDEAITIEARRRRYHRGNNGQFFGAWDAKLALTGSLAVGGIGGKLQEEVRQMPAELYAQMDMGPFSILANSPLDNKALGVAIATYGVASIARRYVREKGTDAAIDKTIAAAMQAESVVPRKRSELFWSNMRRRAYEAIGTATAVFGSYKIAEHGTLEQDLAASMALSAAAVGSMAYAQIKDNLYRRRRGF